MDSIKRAIETGRKYSGYAGEIKEFADIALIALQEKVEHDKMRCDNCNFKDHELCRAVWKTKYNIKKEKWTYKTMMEDDGFCSRFAPKETTQTGLVQETL